MVWDVMLDTGSSTSSGCKLTSLAIEVGEAGALAPHDFAGWILLGNFVWAANVEVCRAVRSRASLHRDRHWDVGAIDE